MDRADAIRQIPYALAETNLTGFPHKHAGKVRDSYYGNGPTRVIVTTDRISAFDFHVGLIPFKGQILNQMAKFWFDHTQDIIQNHVVAMPHPNVMIAKECKPLPIEMVVRGYITGVTGTSMWHKYSAGGREFCGHTLPDGLKKNDKLPTPLITPSTKESEKNKHDRSVSSRELLEFSGIDPALYAEIEKVALKLFARGTEIAARAGFILVDTKYEFGLDANGALTLIDEIHTPDSSRYWKASSYAARQAAGEEQDYYDKEFVRLRLAALGLNKFGMEAELKKLPADLFADAAMRYAEVFENITGQTLAIKIGNPMAAIQAAVNSYTAETMHERKQA
jgi:phosphoribosylaminoimidazole-succinocarboxamide synthase